jgi:hypothetical protein
MNCAWCAKPAAGTAMEPEDISRQPSCGAMPACGIFFKAGATS